MLVYLLACLLFVQAEAEVDGINPKTADILSSVPMRPLPSKQQIKLSMPVGQVGTDKIKFKWYTYISS